MLSTSTAMLKGGPLADPYKVLQLHFHWGSDDTKGSEHTYDGMAFPMELHVVHWNSRYKKSDGSPDLDKILASVDGLAVTGFMFKTDVSRTKLYHLISINLIFRRPIMLRLSPLLTLSKISTRLTVFRS